MPSLEVTPAIEAKVNSWQIGQSAKIGIATELTKIAHVEEASLGREIRAPVRGFVRTFTVWDDENGVEHLVTVWISTTERPGVRLVIEVSYKTLC